MSQKTALERAQAAVQAANLQDGYLLERSIRGRHNEVWFYGPYMLRIAPEGHSLEQEAHILRLLPHGIPHAPVIAADQHWIVQKRAEGVPLSTVWTRMGAEWRRAATQQLAAVLINLHQLRISGLPSLSPGWFAAILPAVIIKKAETLQQSPGIDADLMNHVIAFTQRTMIGLKPPLRWGFVHRELHFDHIMWNGERITALLDFENAVLGPRELELEMIVHFMRYPALHTTANLHVTDLHMLLDWLQEDYPLLFSEAGVEQRLMLYSIEHDLRLLPDDPAAQDRLRAVIES